MDITEIASKLFLDKLSGQQGNEPSADLVQNALKNLLPTEGGQLDISSLVNQFMGQGGLASLAASWLGDGSNQSLSIDKIFDLLGQDKVNEFAGNLGLENNTAASALSDMIPDLIDKVSSGGSLNSDMVGSLVSGIAGKFFK